MKHNFPKDDIVVKLQITKQQLKEIIDLAYDQSMDISNLSPHYLEEYPYLVWNDSSLCLTSDFTFYKDEVNFEEFKAFLQGKGKYKSPFSEEIQLNSEYKAIVTKNKIIVGCQTFTHETVKKLYQSSQKALKS